MTDSAPDFLDPIVGYRAWHVDPDGYLAAWSFAAVRWEPGVNTARCLTHRGHRPPVAECMCGLYALSDPSDRRLDFRRDQAVGAIAAWGDMEVHRTGFRAESACIVALALPEHASADQRALLEKAAARYRVDLVPALELSKAAARHGAPLPEEWLPAPLLPRRSPSAAPAPLPPAPAIDAGGFTRAARGLAPEEHLWVETGLGGVVLGLTPSFAQLLDPDVPAPALPATGTKVRAGDRLGTLPGRDGPLAVWAPVSGTVNAVNPRLQATPGLLHDDPESGGWLLRLIPSDWDREGMGLSWDAPSARAYAGLVARPSGDPFADLRVDRLRAAPSPTTWKGVLEAMRAEREKPRFPDADALHAELEAPISAAVADPETAASLARLDARVVWRTTDPDSTLVLDLRPAGVRAGFGGGATAADLTLHSTAETLVKWLTGTLDPAGALRRGELRSDRPDPRTMRTLAVLKHLRIARLAHKPSWA